MKPDNWKRWYIDGDILTDSLTKKKITKGAFGLLTSGELSKHFGCYYKSRPSWFKTTGWWCKDSLKNPLQKRGLVEIDIKIFLMPLSRERIENIIAGHYKLLEMILNKKAKIRVKSERRKDAGD